MQFLQRMQCFLFLFIPVRLPATVRLSSLFCFVVVVCMLCERHDVALRIHLTMQFQEVHFETEEEEIPADDSTAEALV